MKTILLTGIGGLTPRSIAGIIRRNHSDYKIIGCDIEKKAVSFFMSGLLDVYYICPRYTSQDYFPWVEKLVKVKRVDYAFVQPEAEIVKWGAYYEKYGKFPCPVFMGCKKLSESLRDKSIMAELLEGADYIPKIIKVTQANPRFENVEKLIGFPCWIRATEGTRSLGSLRLDDISSYKSWLFINSNIPEFMVSEFLTGRHLANQMLYYNGEYVAGAVLECAEYVIGNTHFGRFLNEDRINEFRDRCIKNLEKKLGVLAHGILSFDLKEDSRGELKVTEGDLRYMAYTSVMAHAGFDLIEDIIRIMEDGNCDHVERAPYYHFEKTYVFLRDADVEPILLDSESVFDRTESIDMNSITAGYTRGDWLKQNISSFQMLRQYDVKAA